MNKLVVLVLLLISGDIVYSQPIYQLDNLDFEKGVVGQEAFPWRFSQTVKQFGYMGYITDSLAYEGNKCFKIVNPNKSYDSVAANDPNECTLYQNVEPSYYQNRRVRFGIYAKLESTISQSKAELWIIAKDGKNKIPLSYFDSINVVKGADWKEYIIEAVIPNGVSELRFGVLFFGGGVLYLDKASFEIINPKDYVAQNNISLNYEQIGNINRLAKVYAAMSYFLPSDNGVKTNWRSYLEEYLASNIVNSKSNNFIEKFVEPYSRAAYISKNKPELEQSIAGYKPNNISYAMLYRGVPSVLFNESENSYRKNIYSSTRRREGSITMVADLIKYSGMELRISLDMKVDKESLGANAQLWARVDIANSKEFLSRTTAEEPVVKNTWEKRTLSIELPDNVYRVKLALVLIGEGKANYDNIEMGIYDKGKLVKKLDDYNLDFEYAANLNKIADWEIDPAVINAGYSFDMDSTAHTKGKHSLLIWSDSNRVVYPAEGTYLSIPIGNNDYFNLNICSYTRDGHTIPMAKDSNVVSMQDSIFRGWEDVNGRIAALIEMYALLVNFSANEIDQFSIDSSFNFNLQRLCSVVAYEDCSRVLNDFMLVAKDSRVRVWNSFVNYDYGVPLYFERIKYDYVVTQNYDNDIPITVGDKILKINDIPIHTYIDSLASQFYSSNIAYNRLKAEAIARAGLKDSKLKLTIETNNKSIQDVVVSRTRLLNDIYTPRPKSIDMLNDSTVYIDMTEVSDKSIKDLLDRLEHFRYFVFDLRGESIMSEHILSLFTDSVIPTYNWILPFYTYPYKRNVTREIFYGMISPKLRFSNKALYFLINERSIGYSDFIAKVVKKNKLGLLVGNKTMGNPSEVVTTRLSSGFSVAMSSVLCLDDNGIAILDDLTNPDIDVEENLNDVLNGKDIYIEKVLKLIENK